MMNITHKQLLTVIKYGGKQTAVVPGFRPETEQEIKFKPPSNFTDDIQTANSVTKLTLLI
jgi:hypothetical protein